MSQWSSFQAPKAGKQRDQRHSVMHARASNFTGRNLPELNGCLIAELRQMKAAPLIQEALVSDHVDDFWSGDWDEAQYKLGLKERPAIPAERVSTPLITSTPTRPTMSATTAPVHRAAKKSPTSKKGKAKMKMARASRKANQRKR
jgi:hypothetical protein